MARPGTDSRYSWVIAAACCWVTFVIQGLVRCSGVVYVALIDAYGVTRAQASWPFTLRIAVWNLSGPVAGALSYKWSIRSITFTGVLLVTITNILCWFASDIHIVTLFLGGLQGLGVGMAITLVPVIINQYFSKYKSTEVGIACAGATAGSFALPPIVEYAIEDYELSLGVGMAVTLVPVIINQYFSKYKSTGAGIACAGATAGSFALPPIVEYAIEEYGLRGAFLMMAGITLHGVLGAALMRPASWLKKKNVAVIKNGHCGGNSQCSDQNLNFLKSRSSERLNSEEIKKLLNTSDNDQVKPRSKSVRFSCDDGKNDEDESSSLIGQDSNPVIVKGNGNCNHPPTSNGYEPGSDNMPTFSSPSLPPIAEDNADSDIETVRYGKLEFIDREHHYDPQINLKPTDMPSALKNGDANHSNGVILKPNESCMKTHKNSSLDPGFQSRSWLHGIMEPIKAACQILKNPMFLIIASNYSVFFLSYMTYLIIIVDYSLDLGVDRTDSVFLVSTFSIADLCGRLGSGWITDSGIVKRKHLMMGNMLTVGGLLIATSFTTTYIAVTAVSVSCGLVVGVNLILFYALLEEYLGLSQMPMAVGLMNFSIGVISLVTPLLTGYFRDTMGSYDHLFHFLGGLSVFCGCLWIYEPFYSRRIKKKQTMRQELGC